MVVASSYSGDTAETLALFEESVARGCRLVAITSGGLLDRRAEELGVGRVLVPGGQMPRAAFGYLSLGALGALEAMGIVPTHGEDVAESIEELAGLVSEAGPDVSLATNPAKVLASELGDRVPVVWGARGSAPSRRPGGSVSSTRTPRCQRSRPCSPSSITTRSSDGRGTVVRGSR